MPNVGQRRRYHLEFCVVVQGERECAVHERVTSQGRISREWGVTMLEVACDAVKEQDSH